MLKCTRCNKQIKNPEHPLTVVCDICLSENPKLSTKEKGEMNLWDHVDSFFTVYEKMKKKEWLWFLNTECKYINLRIDMRDGGCIIKDREGKRISPEYLAWQYSDKTPNPPE